MQVCEFCGSDQVIATGKQVSGYLEVYKCTECGEEFT